LVNPVADTVEAHKEVELSLALVASSAVVVVGLDSMMGMSRPCMRAARYCCPVASAASSAESVWA
jgi:hypothetical protein